MAIYALTETAYNQPKQLLGGVIITNYSEQYVLFQTWNPGESGFLQEIYVPKKRAYAEVVEYYQDPNIPVPVSYVIIKQIVSFDDKYTSPVIAFDHVQVTQPSAVTPEELVKILNGWFLNGGIPISVNGGTVVQPLYGINFIEGANININVAQNLPTNQLDVTISALGGGGGFSYTTVAVNTTPYAVVPITGWYMYLVDATAGNITINFPTAVGNNAVYTVKKVDASANTVILTPNGAETIDGLATQTIRFQNTSVDIYSNNANLYIK